MVNVVFRSGSCHSNHGKDFIDSVESITKLIRNQYREDVPVIVVSDSGFLDDKAFTYFEETLKIGYIIAGKMYNEVKQYIRKVPAEQYKKFTGSSIWNYVEFGNKLQSWKKFRRVIYTNLETTESGQLILDFARPDSILYTNN